MSSNETKPTPPSKTPLVDDSLGVKVAVLDANAQLAEVLGLQEKTVQETNAQEERDYQYYVACRRKHIGIFLTRNVGQGVVTEADWYSRDKEVGAPWSGDIFCQQCATYDKDGAVVEGTENQLQVTYIPTGTRRKTAFSVPDRFLMKYPRDPVRRKAEGASRVFRSKYETNNIGLPKAAPVAVTVTR